MSNADGIWERMVTKGDIGLHYISIFQYQHDHSHDRGEGCRRTAKGRNILQLSGCHKSHVELFFLHCDNQVQNTVSFL